VPEYSKGPPHSRSTEVDAGAIIDDEIIGVIQAQGTHAGGKLVRLRQHVRERGVGVAACVEIEEDGTRDVTVRIFSSGVTPTAREIPGAIHHPETGSAQASCEPGGRDYGG
jgi:hypothetical protein